MIMNANRIPFLRRWFQSGQPDNNSKPATEGVAPDRGTTPNIPPAARHLDVGKIVYLDPETMLKIPANGRKTS
jgi:hypothetical protein